MDLSAAAAELYGLSPDTFVARRTELVAEARAAKDRDLARRLGQLRRPTRTAWLVNRLARDEADRLTELLRLGPALAEAQQRMDGAELRRLSAERRRLIDVLTRAALELGRTEGYQAPDGVRQEVGQTLQAALADAEVEAAVRDGVLTQAVSYGGFGPDDLMAALAASTPRPAGPRPDEPATGAGPDGAGPDGAGPDGAGPDGAGPDEAGPDAQSEQRERREAARAAAAEARDRADRAGEEADEATARADALAEELEQLRSRLRATETAEREALDAARAARRRHQELRRAAQQAEDEAQRGG